MKPALFTVSFLLFAFITDLPLAFSQEPVLDTDGNPLRIRRGWYDILPVNSAQGGGLMHGNHGNHTCSVAVLQLGQYDRPGFSIIFRVPYTWGTVFTNTSVEIEFQWNPGCVKSVKWVVVDDEPQWLAIGDEYDTHEKIISGSFMIQKYGLGYKFVFCPTITASPGACINVGRNDELNEDKEGRLLILKDDDPYQFQFVNFDYLKRTIA